MTEITIPNIDDHTLQGLKQLAWRRGLPLQESLRRLLEDAVDEDLGRWHAKGNRDTTRDTHIPAHAA